MDQCPQCGFSETPPPLGRLRKPRDPQGWPPGIDIEARIDALCSCRGRYDCACVSVFNQAQQQAWFEYNSKADPPQ